MRTLTIRALLLAAAVLGPLRAAAENKTVHVDVPGTLTQLLTAEEKENLTSLTVSGSLNGTDIGLIGKMTGAPMSISADANFTGSLTELNMQDARIVEGGDYYASGSGRRYHTQNDVFPTLALAGSQLTSVVLPSTIKAVGQTAFAYSESLSSVTFTGDVDSICASAFSGCPQLSEVTLQKVHYIGDQAFSGTAISTLTLPDGLDSLGNAVFYSCGNLRELHMPNSVVKMGESTFQYCDSLTSVTLSAGLTEIPAQSFRYCTQLRDLTLPNGIKRIGDNAFMDCPATPLLPDGLVEIGRSAFPYYGKPTVELPSSLRTIGRGAFEWSELTSIVIPEGVDSVEDGHDFASNGAFEDCEYLRRAVIPSTLRRIASYMFEGCERLTDVTIAEGVEEIGEGAFRGCEALETLDLPASLRRVGDQSLAECSALSAIALPEGLTVIGEEAFKDDESLATASLPSTLTEVGRGAFMGCSALTSLRVDAVTPPTAYVNSFIDVDVEACTLYVPKGAVDAYRAAPYWQDFLHITDEPAVGIGEALATTQPKVVGRYTTDGRPATASQRGVQVWRMSDGTTRKVIVK